MQQPNDHYVLRPIATGPQEFAMSSTEIIQTADPAVTDIRDRLYKGRAALAVFAEAMGCSERTISSYIQQGLPVEYIGRKPLIVIEQAVEWLRNRRRKDAMPPPRGRGRPRKAA